LIDALLMCGLLEQTEIEPYRPVVRLTERGTELMAGRTDRLPLMPLSDGLLKQFGGTVGDKNAPGASHSEAPSTEPDRELVARLRKWREETSRTASLPAYMVLSNSAIDELARVHPASLDELLGVKGIGPAKSRQYGEALLGLVAAMPAAMPAAPPADEPVTVAASEMPVTKNGVTASSVVVSNEIADEPLLTPSNQDVAAIDHAAAKPSHYWTWRLLSAGFSPDECAAIRGLAPEVVLDHVLRAADGGLTVDARWFLSDEAISRIEQLLHQGPTTRIRQLLDHLPRGTRYEEVQLVLKARGTQQAG
jgi:ATP-dependent DNA helicase RecQ